MRTEAEISRELRTVRFLVRKTWKNLKIAPDNWELIYRLRDDLKLSSLLHNELQGLIKCNKKRKIA